MEKKTAQELEQEIQALREENQKLREKRTESPMDYAAKVLIAIVLIWFFGIPGCNYLYDLFVAGFG